MDLLFVYGSMKKGFRNHFRMEKENFIGNAITKEKYSMYPDSNYSFPYAIKENQEFNLKGELYEIKNIGFSILDDFEGVPTYYQREIIPVICDDKEHNAYIYFRASSNKRDYEDDLLIDEWTKEYEHAGDKLDEFFMAIRDAVNSKK